MEVHGLCNTKLLGALVNLSQAQHQLAIQCSSTYLCPLSSTSDTQAASSHTPWTALRPEAAAAAAAAEEEEEDLLVASTL